VYSRNAFYSPHLQRGEPERGSSKPGDCSDDRCDCRVLFLRG
jgi:hypothetical protein